MGFSGPIVATLLIFGLATAAGATHGQRALPPIRIVLVGDSTVTDGSGWGTGFSLRVSPPAVVVNLSAEGRSSKSFIDEGRWAEALGRRGDYYLIQFGHNDEPGKGPERETDPETTFRGNLERYVADARAIGARPVLVTSLVRRLYEPDGTIRTTQTPYVEVVRRLAREKQVPLIDLHAISMADAEHAGEEVWADLSPRDDKQQVDRTHLNAKGSEVVGRMVADALRLAVPDLTEYIVGAAASARVQGAVAGGAGTNEHARSRVLPLQAVGPGGGRPRLLDDDRSGSHPAPR